MGRPLLLCCPLLLISLGMQEVFLAHGLPGSQCSMRVQPVGLLAPLFFFISGPDASFLVLEMPNTMLFLVSPFKVPDLLSRSIGAGSAGHVFSCLQCLPVSQVSPTHLPLSHWGCTTHLDPSRYVSCQCSQLCGCKARAGP